MFTGPSAASGRFALAILLAGSLAISGCTSTASSSSNAPTGRTADVTERTETVVEVERDLNHVTRTGEVYLMRGLLNIFSRGMDVMAGRMRAKGLNAISFNHANWLPYAEDIVARAKQKKVSYPIIIMGHSLGGNEAPKMANYLAAHRVPTKLIVTFDPTETGIVGRRIDRVINYYLPNGKNRIRKAGDFKGRLSNVDVSDMPEITHTNVEKNGALQNRSIKRVIAITRKLPQKKRRTS